MAKFRKDTTHLLSNLIKELGVLTSDRSQRVFDASESAKQRTHDSSILKNELANILALQQLKETGLTTRGAANNATQKFGFQSDYNSDLAGYAKDMEIAETQKNSARDVANMGLQGNLAQFSTQLEMNENNTASSEAISAGNNASAESINADNNKMKEILAQLIDGTQRYKTDANTEDNIRNNKSVLRGHTASERIASLNADASNYASNNQFRGVQVAGQYAQDTADAETARIQKDKEYTRQAQRAAFVPEFAIGNDITEKGLYEEDGFYLNTTDVNDAWEQDHKLIKHDIESMKSLGIPLDDPRWGVIREGLSKYLKSMNRKGYLDGGMVDKGAKEQGYLKQVQEIMSFLNK
tara:strand:- start:2127 stop:3185 length:1059 start_codon:yes stop_codon:yes gene_type:complete